MHTTLEKQSEGKTNTKKDRRCTLSVLHSAKDSVDWVTDRIAVCVPTPTSADDNRTRRNVFVRFVFSAGVYRLDALSLSLISDDATFQSTHTMSSLVTLSNTSLTQPTTLWTTQDQRATSWSVWQVGVAPIRHAYFMIGYLRISPNLNYSLSLSTVRRWRVSHTKTNRFL